MTELVCRPFHDEFMRLCTNANKKIKLCAPFVKYNTINEIYKSTSSKVSLSLITNINLQSFHKKASDISAVLKII